MKDEIKIKREKKQRRHKRIRAKIKGSATCPRFSVFRSNQHISVQLIDDNKRETLVSFDDLMIKNKKGLTKIQLAKEIGRLVAKKALDKKIKKVVFDRGGYKYHGRVKAMAEGAREEGLKF